MDFEFRKQFTFYVYALFDPRTHLIRYVGKTVNLEERHTNHIHGRNESNSEKRAWINHLKKDGYVPGFVVLEKSTIWSIDKVERFWIKKLNKKADLLNIAGLEKEREMKVEMKEKHCKNCYAFFPVTRKGRKFCNSRCANMFWLKKNPRVKSVDIDEFSKSSA